MNHKDIHGVSMEHLDQKVILDVISYILMTLGFGAFVYFIFKLFIKVSFKRKKKKSKNKSRNKLKKHSKATIQNFEKDAVNIANTGKESVVIQDAHNSDN